MHHNLFQAWTVLVQCGGKTAPHATPTPIPPPPRHCPRAPRARRQVSHFTTHRKRAKHQNLPQGHPQILVLNQLHHVFRPSPSPRVRAAKQWTAKRKSPDEKHSGPPRGSHQTTSTVNRQEEVTRRKAQWTAKRKSPDEKHNGPPRGSHQTTSTVDRQEEVTRRKAQWTAKRKSPDDKHSGPPRGSHQTTSTVDRQEEVTRRKAQWTAKRKSPDDKHSGLPRGSHQTTSTVDRQEEVTRRQATVGHDRLRTQSQVPGSCTPPSTATGNRRRLARWCDRQQERSGQVMWPATRGRGLARWCDRQQGRSGQVMWTATKERSGLVKWPATRGRGLARWCDRQQERSGQVKWPATREREREREGVWQQGRSGQVMRPAGATTREVWPGEVRERGLATREVWSGQVMWPATRGRGLARGCDRQQGRSGQVKWPATREIWPGDETGNEREREVWQQGRSGQVMRPATRERGLATREVWPGDVTGNKRERSGNEGGLARWCDRQVEGATSLSLLQAQSQTSNSSLKQSLFSGWGWPQRRDHHEAVDSGTG